MHYHHIEDAQGDLVELVPFCCASCAQDWCRENELDYQGWNGCQEGADYPEWCANCGVRSSVGGETDCDGLCVPVVCNLIGPPVDPEATCEHGVRFWIETDGR